MLSRMVRVPFPAVVYYSKYYIYNSIPYIYHLISCYIHDSRWFHACLHNFLLSLCVSAVSLWLKIVVICVSLSHSVFCCYVAQQSACWLCDSVCGVVVLFVVSSRFCCIKCIWYTTSWYWMCTVYTIYVLWYTISIYYDRIRWTTSRRSCM